MYQGEHTYTLTNAAIGQKTIYAKAQDSSYQESESVSDTIILSNGIEIQEIATIYNVDDTITINARAVNVLTGTVSGAEYFITTVGTDGTGAAFSAVDGTFDSASEDITVTLSGITPDTETLIYLHGKNETDEWGAYLEYKLYPTAENLLKTVAENYKKIKTLQGEYNGKQWTNDSLISEGIFSVRK